MKLTDYVRRVSLEDFGQPFRHEAFWNSRLRTTGGRFFPEDGHLDFNPRHYNSFGEVVFRKIVRHELCHYHLYYAGLGYRHGDRDFKSLLARVDGLRFAPQLPHARPRQQYRCQSCGTRFSRQRRVDTARYRCGRCHGRLVYDGSSLQDTTAES